MPRHVIVRLHVEESVDDWIVQGWVSMENHLHRVHWTHTMLSPSAFKNIRSVKGVMTKLNHTHLNSKWGPLPCVYITCLCCPERKKRGFTQFGNTQIHSTTQNRHHPGSWTCSTWKRLQVPRKWTWPYTKMVCVPIFRGTNWDYRERTSLSRLIMFAERTPQRPHDVFAHAATQLPLLEMKDVGLQSGGNSLYLQTSKLWNTTQL